jgi:hypothetical protein
LGRGRNWNGRSQSELGQDWRRKHGRKTERDGEIDLESSMSFALSCRHGTCILWWRKGVEQSLARTFEYTVFLLELGIRFWLGSDGRSTVDALLQDCLVRHGRRCASVRRNLEGLTPLQRYTQVRSHERWVRIWLVMSMSRCNKVRPMLGRTTSSSKLAQALPRQPDNASHGQ